MKPLFVLATLVCFATGWSQDSLVFSNRREMSDYAFRLTNFSNLPSAYLINRTMELNDTDYGHYLRNDTTVVSGTDNLHLFTLLEWWDTNKNFRRDSVIFPVYDHFFTLDEERPLHIPLFVTDIDAIALRQDAWNNFTISSDTKSFPLIDASDVTNKHIETASIFLDSFSYNNVFIDLNDQTVFSNRNRSIVGITLKSGTDEKQLAMNSSVDISDWLNGDQLIEMEILFDDSTTFTKRQNVEMRHRATQKSLPGFYTTVEREYYDNGSALTTINNPEAKYAVYYACEDHKLRKPFLMIAGWGPHTDKAAINNNQHWPKGLGELANQFNQEGLIEDLHSKGFDVVVVQFNPPNADILKNCVLLEKVIHSINGKKYANNSYEENIIMGFSAGALAARLTLQQMEKKHLEQNGPHPHTKLFISNDGENGGANVPLGMQHAVEYLMNYEYNNFFTDYNTYALHYILNAPLSRELLHYFHTATGSGSNPGQGPDPMRTAYLQHHAWNNHSMNTHLPGYPSFQRNVSISNGSSVPQYNFANYTCSHEPYPSQTGAIFFKQSGSLMGWVDRRFEATFLKHGIHRVFYYEYKPLFKSWRVGYEATTMNPLVLDNAPGGIIFIDKNPLITINNELQSELTGSPDIQEDHLFSFTPTILTHDVKNLNGQIYNGYPNYNFKEQHLMYDSEQAAGNPVMASHYYGYPHLGYPGSHYDIVPFDALFTWDQNTEHLIGNKKSVSTYNGVWSEMKPVLKNFIVDEAEAWNIFLQNKRIGHYARPSFVYRVDYEAQYGIYLGEHVTQKTDFLAMTSEPNAVVEAQAGAEIVFKPGAHLKAGTTFHAFIGDVACEKSMAAVLEEPEESTGSTMLEIKSDSEPVIYPNPNAGSFTITWDEVNPETPLTVTAADLSGKELFSISSFVGIPIEHELRKGLYIINIQKGELWFSRRIIVQ
jgi:hypothetical protein